MDSWIWIIIAILGAVAIIIFVIAAIVAAFLRTRKRRLSEVNDWNWYLQITLSHKDALSQWSLVLGSLALANTVYVVNNNFDGPLSWRAILLIAVVIFGLIAYFGRSAYAAAIGIVGFLVWWGAQSLFWQNETTDIASSVAAIVGWAWLAILLYPSGFLQMQAAAWKRFGIAYIGISLLLINFLLFVFSTQGGLRIIEERFFGAWQNAIALFVIGGAGVVVTLYAWTKKIILGKEMLVAGALFILFGFLAISPVQSIFAGYDELTPLGLAWAAIFNFALFVEILGVIFAGYLRREIWMVNFGAVLLIIFVAVKYFDWFFKFLDKSAFFIFAGILLFGVGWTMERGRRYLAQSIKSRINQPNQ